MSESVSGDFPRIRACLLDWFDAVKRDLPWRKDRHPYRVWVSEIMLQQTRVEAVIPYFQRFMDAFPDLESLAGADEQQVLKLWEGLGYYARARNLRKAARRVVAEHDGVIPADWKRFRELPGVGEYIASAVLSIAFEQPLAVADGNVRRVLSRLFLSCEPVNRPASYRFFQQKARALLDETRPGDFNQAVMELGQRICLPRAPVCAACPVSRDCAAKQRDKVAEVPVRQARPRPPLVEVSAGVVVRDGKLLITRRPADGLLGGLWEFPGGKLRPGETPDAACIRELKEETGLDVRVVAPLAHVRHAYTHFRIRLHVFICERQGGNLRLKGPVDFRWVRPDELDQFPFPRANLKFRDALRAYLARSAPDR